MSLQQRARVERRDALRTRNSRRWPQGPALPAIAEIRSATCGATRRARRHACSTAAQSRDDAAQHFAVIEFGERRKARALGKDQADDVLAPRPITSPHEQHRPAFRPASETAYRSLARSRYGRPAGSASSAPVPGTASPCRRSRDRSCPWRRPRVWRHRRAAPPRSPAPKTPRAPPTEWPARRAAPRNSRTLCGLPLTETVAGAMARGFAPAAIFIFVAAFVLRPAWAGFALARADAVVRFGIGNLAIRFRRIGRPCLGRGRWPQGVPALRSSRRTPAAPRSQTRI